MTLFAPRTPPRRFARPRVVAACVALVVMVAALLVDAAGGGPASRGRFPWGASSARADCLDVPAPKYFIASLDTTFPAGNEFLGRIRLAGFTDDFTGFFTPLPTFPGPTDDRGVDGLEIEFRDVTSNGAFRLLTRAHINRFSMLTFTADVVMTEAPDSPDPDLLYLGRTYEFRMRAIAMGLGTNGARDESVAPACTFPWSAVARVTTPSDGTPGINVSTTALDFGDVELGFTAKRTLTVRNGDATQMTIKLPKSKSPFIHNARSPLVLDPNESADIEVTFSPDDVASETQAFRLVGPKGVATVVVDLTGRGVPATPRLAFDVSTLDFGRLRGSAKKSVAVTNLTDQSVAVEISTPRPPFYRVSGSTLTLPPRGTAFVEFEFIPREDAATFTGSARFEVVNMRESPKQSLALTGGILDTMVVKSTSTSGGTGVEYRILPGDWTKLLPGQELPPGAEIACDPDASVQLEMPDGTGIDMGPGTQIKVAAFFKKGGRVEAEILATFGDIVSRIPRHDVVRSDFKIRSPTATASVRGTAFTTSIDPATGDTTYRVTEGTVAVKPTARGSKTILVKAGNQVTVTKKGAGPITPYVP